MKPRIEFSPFNDQLGTLKDQLTGEIMHSRIGPKAEAELLYYAQSGLRQGLSKPTLRLWDVGMGTGTNAWVTLERVALAPPPGLKRLEIISFELLPETLSCTLECLERNVPAFEFLKQEPVGIEPLSALEKTGVWSSKGLGSSNIEVSWRVLWGDFRETYARPLVDGGPADLIYYDFYRPQSAPELWGIEMAQILRHSLEPEGRLISYATASSFCAALLLNGFTVFEGRGTPAKKASTLALRTPTTTSTDTTLRAVQAELGHGPLAHDYFAHLRRSTRPLPLDLRPEDHEGAWTELARVLGAERSL